MKRLVRNIQHYLPLYGILIAGLLVFFLFSYDKTFQAAAIVATAAGYVAWGIVHHHLHKDLSVEIVIEYAVVAALGVIIVWSLLLRT